MTETLIQQLDRIEGELKLLRSIKPPKQVDYSEDISLLKNNNAQLKNKYTTLSDEVKSINKKIVTIESKEPPKQVDYSEGISLLERVHKELNKRFSDLHNKYYELNKELLTIKNKRPVEQLNYSDDISALKKELNRLKSESSKPILLPFVNIDEFEAKTKADEVEKNKVIERVKAVENKKETKQHDYSPEIKKINLAIEHVKATVIDNKIDIKKEIEKHVNESYITNLYRNK